MGYPWDFHDALGVFGRFKGLLHIFKRCVFCNLLDGYSSNALRVFDSFSNNPKITTKNSVFFFLLAEWRDVSSDFF